MLMPKFSLPQTVSYKIDVYAKPHLFLLNKGMNEEDCENIYFVAYSLWQTKFWHQHLVGSVIPFLRLLDFKREFFPKTKIIMEEHEQHVKHVQALKLLEQKEQQFHQNINLINDLRRVIIYRYCNK